jgi:hypothetical protein
MASVAPPPSCTVEDVLKTAEATFNEYQSASQRFASDANALLLLPALGLAVDRVRDRLESIVDDNEVLERLQNVAVGDSVQRPFLSGLNMDMQAIYTYLRNAGPSGTPLKKAEVDVYAQALNRYGEVLKIVQKKNAKYTSVSLWPALLLLITSSRNVIQRIETEVLCLNEILTTMYSHLSRNNQLSEGEMLGTFACRLP